MRPMDSWIPSNDQFINWVTCRTTIRKDGFYMILEDGNTKADYDLLVLMYHTIYGMAVRELKALGILDHYGRPLLSYMEAIQLLSEDHHTPYYDDPQQFFSDVFLGSGDFILEDWLNAFPLYILAIPLYDLSIHLYLNSRVTDQTGPLDLRFCFWLFDKRALSANISYSVALNRAVFEVTMLNQNENQIRMVLESNTDSTDVFLYSIQENYVSLSGVMVMLGQDAATKANGKLLLTIKYDLHDTERGDMNDHSHAGEIIQEENREVGNL